MPKGSKPKTKASVTRKKLRSRDKSTANAQRKIPNDKGNIAESKLTWDGNRKSLGKVSWARGKLGSTAKVGAAGFQGKVERKINKTLKRFKRKK